MATTDGTFAERDLPLFLPAGVALDSVISDTLSGVVEIDAADLGTNAVQMIAGVELNTGDSPGWIEDGMLTIEGGGGADLVIVKIDGPGLVPASTLRSGAVRRGALRRGQAVGGSGEGGGSTAPATGPGDGGSGLI